MVRNLLIILFLLPSGRSHKNHTCCRTHSRGIKKVCHKGRILSGMQGTTWERRSFQVSQLCLERLVCKFCRPGLPQFYLKHTDVLKQTEIKFNRLWTQCQRCQGSLHQDVLCTSKDCPIFYMRKKAQKEVKEASDLMQKFDFDW